MLPIKTNDVPLANSNNGAKSVPFVISMVAHAAATQTHHVNAEKIICAIKTGKWEKPLKEIRNLYTQTLLKTDDRKSAKLAVDFLKKKLAAILPSGTFLSR